MSERNERVYIESIIDKGKYLEIAFCINGRTERAISKNPFFKNQEKRSVWVNIESTQAGIFILHPGRVPVGGNFEIDQRLKIAELAAMLTGEFIKKDTSTGPLRAMGVLRRFYQTICNVVSGEIQDDRSHDFKAEKESLPANDEFINSEVVKNGLSNFEADSPIHPPAGLGD
jgi:hypothetical protein